MINTMCDITVGLFGHIENISILDLYLRIKYTERILRNSDPNKYRQVLFLCNNTYRGLYGNQWTLRAANNVTMEKLWYRDKVDRRDADRDPIRGVDWCNDSEKELWFDLGKVMWRGDCYLFQYHIKYTHENIVNTYILVILQYK